MVYCILKHERRVPVNLAQLIKIMHNRVVLLATLSFEQSRINLNHCGSTHWK